MSQIIKVSALLLGSALLMFAGGLHGLLLSTRGSAEGFSLTALGLLGTTWSAGYIAGTLVVPHMVARVGHIRSFSVVASVAAITILLNLLFVDSYAWVGLRALSGLSFAGAAMIVESWLNEVTDNSRRGTVFSVYTAANLVFATAGQLAISVVGIMGFLPFVIGAIAYALALMPPALTASPQPRPLIQARLNLPLLFQTSPVGVVAALTVGIAGGAFGTLAPVYGVQSGFETATIAYLMSLSIVVGALGQFPFGRLSDRMDRRKIVVATSGFSALVGSLIMIFNPTELWIVYALFAFYGLTAHSIYPVAVAHTNDQVTDGDFGRIASGLLLVFGMGLAIGPVIAAGAMMAFGPVAFFLVTATFHGALAGFALLRMRTSRRPSQKDRSPFQYMPQGRTSTPETYSLDPRAEGSSDVETQSGVGPEDFPAKPT
jgi:MFS family permease